MSRRPALPLRDGVALITGAASGLGRATALALAARGCHLALVDRDAPALAAAAEAAHAAGVTVSTYALDVADHAALTALPARVLADHGRLTVLVNNAGVALVGAFAELSVAEFRWLIEINFLAAVTLTHASLPLLLRQPQAQIVNVSSIFGIVAPAAQTAYAASKFALRGFSESLRHELEGTPVGVTVVHPGGVRTGIALSARVAAGADAALAERQKTEFSRTLRLPPEAAAGQIVRAVERRADRLLIGGDAHLLAAIGWLWPVSYWAVLKRLFASQVKGGPG